MRSSISPTVELYGSLGQQQRAVRLAVWIFLASETMLFAGFIGLWAAYYAEHTRAFHEAARHNTLALGTFNTFVLLTSSLLAALALWAIRQDRGRLAIKLLLGTAGLGAIFLVVKAWEYGIHAEEGLLPGRLMRSTELYAHGASLFYILYWAMTGLHALHLTVAILLLLWIVLRVTDNRETATDHARFEGCTLYWHLVDIVWLFLWPLLYLLR